MAGTQTGDEGRRVDDLLHDGEHAIDELSVADARVVSTNRRLLVIRDREQPRLRAVDRANLGEVRTRTASDRGHLLSAVQWAGLGAFLLLARWLVPLEEFVRPVEPPPGVGLSDLFAAVNALVSLLAFLDEAFLAAGALSVGWAVVRCARYVLSRRRSLEISVAGAEPIRFPASVGDETVSRLRAIVRDGSPEGSDRRDAPRSR